MSTRFLLTLLFAALVVLAVGGWAVHGFRRVATVQGFRRVATT